MELYRNIVFLDNEENEDMDGNLVRNIALRMLHHKTDNSVLWEMPTEQDIEDTLDYLLQWDGTGDEDISYEPSYGGADETVHVNRGERSFIISYNVGLHYIGLTEVIEATIAHADKNVTPDLWY